MARRQIPIFGRLLVLWVGLHVSCSAVAQNSDCKEITDIFEIAEWQTLASGPFDGNVAPAKSLLKGFDSCRVWRNESVYECSAPQTTAQSREPKGLLAEAKAVVAPWRSCFAGWKESSGEAREDMWDKIGAATAFVQFEKGDRRVFFSRGMDKYSAVPNQPVKISFRKLD